MRMRELSLRQDPDLRKELALLARGCDFVLPSRFKKRLRAFQQGQAGVCMSILPTTLVLLACQPLIISAVSHCYWLFFTNWNYSYSWRLLHIGQVRKTSHHSTFSVHILEL